MKELLISSLYGESGGGAGIIAQRIATGLIALGQRVTVVMIGDKGYSFSNEDGIKIIRFRPANIYPFTEKDQHSLWQKIPWQIIDTYNFHCASVLRRIIEEEAPDIIHIHKMRGFSGAVWSVAAHMLPGCIIQTCHDYESMSPDGLLRGLAGKMALRKQWPVRGYQLIRSKLSSGVSVVTAPSHHTLSRIKDSSLFPNARARVIANTHGWSLSDLRSIGKNYRNLVHQEFHFLFMGRLEKEKGIIELCDAFQRAFAPASYREVYLDVAGGGTLETELKSRFGDNSHIRFCGPLYGERKLDALHRATVVVVPSLVEEVFGLTVIEAFAFGKPVIASNIGGLPELIRHGETGWLVAAGNVEILADQMHIVVSMDKSALTKMHRNCFQISEEFIIEKMLADYLTEYLTLKAD